MFKKFLFGAKYRHNYLQLLFVFTAFALMALAAYYSIGNILRGRLLSGAQELLTTAEANVKAGLSETETTLLNSYYIVQGMLERNASRQEILNYLTVTTDWMRLGNRGLVDFYGIYGYINGEFYDSIGMNPGDDYIPQRRPWYQTAVRSGTNVAYTTPYRDWHTSDTVVSAVRNIDLKNGDLTGILTVDINIDWLTKYVTGLAMTSDGYGILLSQNLTLIAHPDEEFLGLQLEELGGAYETIARTLRNNEDVFALRVKDLDGTPVIVFFKRIFNNWYVGIVTPYSQFYQDLNTSARILAVLGIVLSLALCFILLRLSSEKLRSEEENKSKSSFLARMSHEIRTPMNAIIGLGELALREKSPARVTEHVREIKQAAMGLLSIINNILDLSKIEAGNIQITKTNYSISSLLNDVINVIRVRAAEKDLLFTVNVDAAIPDRLCGDEIRLRQIILNLLSNAVKYTAKGYISLNVSSGTIKLAANESQLITLNFEVTDTGIGIRETDKPKLFGDFVRLDIDKNRNIEGTGLGLNITRSLCQAMGGDVTVKSTYGSGSVFTATVIQDFDKKEPVAIIKDPGEKSVLVYNDHNEYTRSLCKSLVNLKVPVKTAINAKHFLENLPAYPFVFISSRLYRENEDRIKERTEQKKADTKLVLLVELEETDILDIPVLAAPAWALSIANMLNGENIVIDKKETEEVHFTAPEVRVLIVDDLPVNLTVAEGLMSPYGMTISTCMSGAEAVELAKTNQYDLIFMDHMMPGMDGIEATAIIRDREKKQQTRNPVTIIALTANAVSGMREMYLKNGFEDFLSKPIEVTKLDSILRIWIAEEKKVYRTENEASVPLPVSPDTSSINIPGVDVKKGIFMTGGKTEGYLQVLSIFLNDLEKRIQMFQTMPDAETMPMFINQVRALKSASGSIGAGHVSALAARLEAAGKSGDTDFITENLENFTQQLAELLKNIKTALENRKQGTESKEQEAGSKEQNSSSQIADSFLIQQLNELAAAIKSQSASGIDKILEELNKKQFDSETEKILEQISDQILITEYDSALEILDSLINSAGRK